MAVGTERYGEAFRRYWAPVLAPAALALLDRIDGMVPGDAQVTIADVGTGSGTLALAALQRWPAAQAIGLDPSPAILELARDEALQLDDRLSDRLDLVTGTAQRLPLDDASVDVALSSFVIHLVRDRRAMLAESFRVLRPGGILGAVSWQAGTYRFEASAVVDRIIGEFGIERGLGSDVGAAYRSPEEAEGEVEEAGFQKVEARIEWLEHRYSVPSYLNVAEHWQYDEVFGAVDLPEREQLREAVRAALAGLPPDALGWRRPLVSVVARRPGTERGS